MKKIGALNPIRFKMHTGKEYSVIRVRNFVKDSPDCSPPSFRVL